MLLVEHSKEAFANHDNIYINVGSLTVDKERRVYRGNFSRNGDRRTALLFGHTSSYVLVTIDWTREGIKRWCISHYMLKRPVLRLTPILTIHFRGIAGYRWMQKWALDLLVLLNQLTLSLTSWVVFVIICDVFILFSCTYHKNCSVEPRFFNMMT